MTTLTYAQKISARVAKMLNSYDRKLIANWIRNARRHPLMHDLARQITNQGQKHTEDPWAVYLKERGKD